ncbi:MAG: DNA-processing protein DprA [Negativicutes bacterium]|nr:DNA-processing protein DprA [Negativicutes bacterium]
MVLTDTEERYYLGCLFRLIHIGRSRAEQLLAFFGDAKTAWLANLAEWRAVIRLSEQQWREVAERKAGLQPEQFYNELQKRRIRLLTRADKAYPRELLQIPDPPACLYLQGNLLPESSCIAVVGSRQASHYGKNAAEMLAEGLAECGFVVVSGLARGIDGAAHRGALKKGATYAVFGCGHDTIYPAEHLKLAEQIRESGALLSEYAFDQIPNAGFFPARNRIISGMSLGVVVVEAKATSGSLITVNCALEQGREVFAVPGSIYSENSQGCHALIRQGAKLVSSLDDIIEEFQFLLPPKAAGTAVSSEPEVALSLMQQKIWNELEAEPRHLDQLSLQLQLPVGLVSAELLQLELMGFAQGLTGGYYTKKN